MTPGDGGGRHCRVNRLVLGVVLAAAAAPGCRRDADERLGLAEKRVAQPFDPAELASGAELERAVAVPAAEVAARLKSFRLVESAELTLAARDTRDTLTESWTLETDARGGVHVVTENSHGYGQETLAVDGGVYTRPRYGRFARHAPEGDEVERAQGGVQGVLAGYLAVLGRFAARKDEGEVTVAGRPARRVRLSLSPSPGRFRDEDPAHAWRRTVKVTELAGVVDVDRECGAPLAAELSAAYTAEQRLPARGGEAPRPAQTSEVAVRLAFRASVDQVGALPPLVAPEGAMPSVTRSRPLVDRQVLLEGLVGGGDK